MKEDLKNLDKNTRFEVWVALFHALFTLFFIFLIAMSLGVGYSFNYEGLVTKILFITSIISFFAAWGSEKYPKISGISFILSWLLSIIFLSPVFIFAVIFTIFPGIFMIDIGIKLFKHNTT
jgi:pheromone shutdown protein TraB